MLHFAIFCLDILSSAQVKPSVNVHLQQQQQQQPQHVQIGAESVNNLKQLEEERKLNLVRK